jgi:hypothetical protein
MKNDTIFIAIPSTDDEELRFTVESIYNNAANPERVFVGVAFLGKKKKLLKELEDLGNKYSNLSYLVTKQKKNDISTLGVGIGRSRAASLYNNQDYFLQVDSHSHFFKNWDEDIISLFLEASRELGTDDLVLTCIPPIYGYEANEKVVRVGPKTRYPQFHKNAFFVGVVPSWYDFNVLEKSRKKFIASPKANSAMIFGNKKFGADTGVCEGSIFYDEEIIYSFNLYGRGTLLVFPNVPDFPIAHLDGNYAVPGHERAFFTEYLNQEKSDQIHEKLRRNYLSFISDPKNSEKIERYKRYAKVDPRRGYFSSVSPWMKEFFE